MSSVMTTSSQSHIQSGLVSGRSRSALVVVLMALLGIALTACGPSAEDTNQADLNAVRAAVGLGELARSPELDVKAKAQADLMARQGTIFHSANLASGVSGGWSAIGENVALAGSVDDAQRALEASPGHYANMVNPSYNHVGIGVTVRDGITYVVQVFVSR